MCLSRRPKARSAEGDGAALAAPSAKPPTCIKTSTRFTANCQIWTVLRGAFEAIFRGRNVIRFSVRFGDSIMRFGGDNG